MKYHDRMGEALYRRLAFGAFAGAVSVVTILVVVLSVVTVTADEVSAAGHAIDDCLSGACVEVGSETAGVERVVADATSGIAALFDTEGFPRRWNCGEWSDTHGWTHIVADIMIFGAYAAIPVALIWFISRRNDVPFAGLFILFGLFIMSCGIGHLIEAIIFWEPVYRLSGALKVMTAGVSWMTVIALLPVIPRALALPGLEKYAEELEQKNAELERFAYTVSHDLKSPLVSLAGLTGMLLEDVKAKNFDEIDGLSERIVRSTESMKHVVDGLLQYSRVGHEHLPDELADSNAVIGRVAETLKSQLEKAGITLEIKRPLPDLRVHEHRLVELVDNLTTNAMKYGCEGEVKRIEIGGRSGAREDILYVRDFGQGIEAQFQTQVFDLFRRLQRDDQGTGVGLAIVRRIMEDYGGRCWVESSPGEGATFWLAFPHDMGKKVGGASKPKD